MKITIPKSNKKQEEREKFRHWSKTVRERDNNECQICGSSYMLNAHHLIPRQFKDYAFNSDNGISLCPKHHKFSRVISAHNNPLAFMIWFSMARPKQFELLKEWNRQIQERLE